LYVLNLTGYRNVPKIEQCHYYDSLRGNLSLSRVPERSSLRVIRANHITIGRRETGEKITSIVLAVEGTKANTPAANPESRAGIVNEGMNHQELERYPLESIHAPTLVIDAKDVSTFLGSKYTAENIANAKLVAFETGGHMLIGHGEDTRAAIKDFLKQQHPQTRPRSHRVAMIIYRLFKIA
jgi:pimeloyl-ACP methyl ester carboxylesterase